MDSTTQNRSFENRSFEDRSFESAQPSSSSNAEYKTSIQLFEEQLVAEKKRVKTGEVRIYKRVVAEPTEVSETVTKEKIVIEIESIYGGNTHLDVDGAQVAADGSVRMGIYEDQLTACRQVVPSQVVSVRKETNTETVAVQAALRREVLDVKTEGSFEIDNKIDDSL